MNEGSTNEEKSGGKWMDRKGRGNAAVIAAIKKK